MEFGVFVYRDSPCSPIPAFNSKLYMNQNLNLQTLLLLKVAENILLPQAHKLKPFPWTAENYWKQAV